MFAFLSKIIQKIQSWIYKPNAFVCRMQKIDGNLCILKGCYFQKKQDFIDLKHPFIEKYEIRFIANSVCGKYNEFVNVQKIK